jgi:NADPH-dependent curcumin reductase CurA
MYASLPFSPRSGFFLPHYTKLFPAHLSRLVELQRAGRLRVVVDREYAGLEAAAEAVAYLQSGKSLGKVVVRVAEEKPAEVPARL